MTLLSYPNPNNVPNAVKNTALKYAYTYIVKELLRLRHNQEGAKFRAGQITKEEWETFVKDWYDPRDDTVTTDLLELRHIIRDFIIEFGDSINLEDIPTL